MTSIAPSDGQKTHKHLRLLKKKDVDIPHRIEYSVYMSEGNSLHKVKEPEVKQLFRSNPRGFGGNRYKPME